MYITQLIYWFRHHLSYMGVLLAALVAVTLFVMPVSTKLLQGNTLYLPGNEVATETIGVSAVDFLDVSMRAHEDGNDSLINNLIAKPGPNGEPAGLLWKIVRMAKYILGAVFMLLFSIYTLNLITSRGEDDSVNTFKGAVRYSLIGFLIIALAEPVAYAFNVARADGNFITSRDALMETLTSGGMSLAAAVQLVQYVLGGIALIFMGLAAFQIIFGTGEEDEITEARKTLKWASVGLVVAASVTFIVSAVAPVDVTDKTELATYFAKVDALGPAEEHAMMLELSRFASRATVLSYVKYFQVIVGAAAVLMLFLAGARMVMAAGNDDVIEKQKKTLPWIFLGLGIILFAEIFVNIFFPLRKVDSAFFEDATTFITGIPGAGELQSFAAQMGGFSNFILTFMGIASVMALIVGALYMSTSIANPEQEEKGKKILLAAGLGILLTISSFALVNTVLSGKAAPGGDTTIEIQ